MRVISVAGARPNFVKIASLVRRMRVVKGIDHLLVHTGQHYDESMSEQFFEDLSIPRPDINLNVGSGTQGEQTAEILRRFEPVASEYQPDVVLVVGDVNSTIACALAAKKIGLDVAHVEAGLRSFDRTMPEEINRVLTDAIADLHFATEESAVRNLRREGIGGDKIFFVGNVMIDTLKAQRKHAEASLIRTRLGLDRGTAQYALVTLHRPSNVDDPKVLESLLRVLGQLSECLPVVFPIHPRTLKSIQQARLGSYLNLHSFRAIEPIGYLDFLNLMTHASLVLTDSGGIQEETTVLGVPCLTVRKNTERPVTVKQGTNQIVGTDPEKIMKAACRALRVGSQSYKIPKFWDGHAAERILRVLLSRYASGPGKRRLEPRDS